MLPLESEHDFLDFLKIVIFLYIVIGEFLIFLKHLFNMVFGCTFGFTIAFTVAFTFSCSSISDSGSLWSARMVFLG